MTTVSERSETTTGMRDLPDGWQVVRFDQMAESITDRVDNPSESGVEYYVGLEHLDSDSLKIRRWGVPTDVEATKLRFKPGDIIFGRRRAYQRKVAVADFEGICSAHALVLRAREKFALPEFLPFFMQSETFFQRALSISVGSLSPTINWKTLAQQEFVIPSIVEQRRIAEILWATEETKDDFARVAAHAVDARRALLNAAMNSACDAMDLHEVELRDACTRITDGTHQPPEFLAEGIPFLLVSNLTSGQVDWNVSKWISEDTYAALTKRVKPEFGDVLYTVVGSYGVPVLINWQQPFAFQRHIALLKPNAELLSGAYLAYFLECDAGKRQAELTAVGNAQKTITLASLAKFTMPLPSLSAQQKEIAKLAKVERAVADANLHIKALAALKTQLMRQLVGANHYV